MKTNLIPESRKKTQTLIEKLQEIESYLAETESLNRAGVGSGIQIVKKRTIQNQDTVDTERAMRLAIVGCMKVGKSSFLNTVLFDGEEILPQAATPMTAALTHISYGEQNSAEIVFYNKSDWCAIEDNAKKLDERTDQLLKEAEEKYKQSVKDRGASVPIRLPTREDCFNKAKMEFSNEDNEAVVACYEQSKAANTQMRLQTGNEESKVINHQDITGLMKELSKYVGAYGEYTPYVKYVKLFIHDERLKGLDITDTPGIHDPIASRGVITTEYVKNSDAILFLTSSDTPLSESEIAFLKKNVPANKYDDSYVVATKLDVLMLQRSVRKTGKFSEDLKVAKATVLKDSIKSMQAKGVSIPQGQFFFVSAWLYDIAQRLKQHKPLTSGMAEILRKLKSTYRDFPADDPTMLEKLGNMQVISQTIIPYYEGEKEKILLGSATGYVKDRASEAIEALGAVLNDTVSRINDLQEFNQEDLSKRKDNLTRALNGMRGDVSSTFSENALAVEEKVMRLIAEIRETRTEYSEIKETLEDKVSYHTEHSGFLGLHLETYRDVTKIRVGEVGSAMQRISEYTAACDKMIASRYRECLDNRQLKNQIQSLLDKHLTINKVTDISSSDLMLFITQELSGLGSVDVTTDPHPYVDSITNKFPNANEKVSPDVLKSVLIATLIDVDNHAAEVLKSYKDRDCQRLKVLSGTFITSFEQSIKKNIDELIRLMEDKEASIARLSEHSDRLNQFMKELQAV